MRTPNSLALSYSLAALAAFFAALMPWGEVPAGPFLGNPVLDGVISEVNVSVDAWHSSVTALGVKLPNWTPLLVAAGLAAWAWAGAPRSRWIIPAIVYGLLHTLGAAVMFQARPGGTIGLGIVVTFIAFVSMLSTTIRYLKEQPAEAAG
ncbi:hypothetical protein EON82_13330 [bacterium]|nr:MAG: hypothetical protein EON82_13330 [bacterium]